MAEERQGLIRLRAEQELPRCQCQKQEGRMEADKGSRDKDELSSKCCLSPVTGEPEPMEHRGLRL